jgi:DNA primase
MQYSSEESTESPVEGSIVEKDIEGKPSISNGASKLSLKDQNIQNLLQLIVRYGEVVIFQSDTVVIRVGEFIINELCKDNIEMKNPTYQLLIDEYMAHYKEPNWVAANFFQYHPDVELSRFAVEMLTDKYQLSRMYAKQVVSENVVKEVAAPSEVDMLPNMVQRMLLELKYTIVNERIDAMKRMLVDAEKRGDWELQRTILAQQPALNAILQELCKALGNRVILH